MSGSYGGGGGYSSSSYQTGSGVGSDATEVQRISSNIQKISRNVSSIKRMVTQLGTQSDTEELRNKLHEIQHYTNQLAKDTNKHLKDLNSSPLPQNASEQRQRKLYRERLMSEFSSALNEFQFAQRKAADKEKASVKRARANSKLTPPTAGITTYDDGFADSSGQEQLISFGQDVPRSGAVPPPHPSTGSGLGASASSLQQPQNQLQIEEDVPLEELIEREKSIRQLESDIMDVNQIFKDLGVMVHEQGEVIDSIEANVESAGMSVQEGTQQLSRASTYQTKARKKMICIVALLLVAAGVIALIIYLSVR